MSTIMVTSLFSFVVLLTNRPMFVYLRSILTYCPECYNMNNKTINKAAKQIKNIDICPVCWEEFKIQEKDRKLHKHGHGGYIGGLCEGSYQTPSSTKAATPSVLNTCTSQGAQGPTIQQSQSSEASQLADEDEHSHVLKHPPWTPLMTRIPKATRVPCANALLNILVCIVADPNNIEWWDNLLSFATSILAKPARGEATRNLTNIVLKRLSGCNDKPTSQNIQTRPIRNIANKNPRVSYRHCYQQQAGSWQLSHSYFPVVLWWQTGTK